MIDATEQPLAGRHVVMAVWTRLRHNVRAIKIASEVAAAGARVTLVASSWVPEEIGESHHEKGFDVVTVRRPAPWALTDARPGKLKVLARALNALPGYFRLCRALRRLRGDVYHAHDIQTLPWTWLAAGRRPVIYDAYEISSDRTGFGRVGGLVTRVEGFFARRIAAMITTTGMRADHFARVHRIPRPAVVQNRPFYVELRRGDKLRRAIAASDDEVIFLYQGGLQPDRGLEGIVERAAEVAGARFVLLGPGVLREGLAARIAELGVGDRVHILDEVPWQELAEWTASADVGLQLLRNVGLNHYTTDSNKIFEYALAGLPVIASDFPEIRRIVTEADFGLLVDPDDDSAVREAMIRLRDDAGLRRHFHRRALANARDLSWETQAPALLAVYRQVLALKAD